MDNTTYNAAVPVSGIEVPENRLRAHRDYAPLAESLSRMGLLNP